MKSFIKNREGSVFAIVALSILGVVGSVGAAVDVGRAQMVKAKLQAAVDAAGLAAGASANSADLDTVAMKYIKLNFAKGTLGATVNSVTTHLSDDQKILTIATQATVPTTFMKILGAPSVTIDSSTEITRTNKGLELAIVLDTTGSMAGQKLADLKTASHDLLNILFGNAATAQNLWVGIVPFTQAVNVGTSHSSWLAYNNLNWGNSSWGGCFDSRYNSPYRDVTDDPPSVQKFAPYYWPDNNTYNDWVQTSNGKTTYSITSTKGPNLSCPSAITPLTNVKATLDTGVDALVAGGNTEVNEGAAWGWRLISPRWQGLWGGSMNTNNLPLAYNTPLMSKAVIIMTDGQNTITNAARGSYGYLNNGYLGTTNSAAAVTALDNKLLQVCSAMKAQGIYVYTILFQTNTQSVIDLMQSCASSPDYFFNSPDGATLAKAFHTIGDSLANLRISQ